MKTIIFAILLFASPLFAQIDTVNFEFKASGSDGKYTMLTNKTTYLGKAAGEIVTPIQFMLASIDTANWLFIPIGSDGTYRLVENKAAFYGMDSGTVRAQIVTGIQTIGRDTTISGSVTISTLTGAIRTDNLTGVAYADITATSPNVTTSSLIFITLYQRELTGGSHIGGYAVASSINAGSFTISVFIDSGAFTEEGWIFYEIKNP